MISQHLNTWTPAGLKLAAIVGGLVLLSLSKPSPERFAATVWPEALAGIKADLQQRRDTSALYSLAKSRLPFLMPALEAGKDTELNQLPAFWQAHTRAENWIIATRFEYEEAACRSTYLGAAGLIIPTGDGCGIEPLRGKP